MTSVLIVDDDAQLRESIARELAAQGFEVSTAADVREATRKLEQVVPDVLITDLRMSDADGIDLLNIARKIAPQARSVLMSAYATARDHQIATELGAVRVLCKPFTSTELVQAIQQAVDCGTGFRGSVHGLSLVDLLQMFHYARRSITVRLGAPVQGAIHIEHGEIVHAEHGEDVGEVALRALLSSPSGAITTHPHTQVSRSVSRNFQSLLLDLLRQLDESSREPEVEFDEGWGGLEENQVERVPSGVPPPVSREIARLAPEVDVSLVERATGRVTPLQGEMVHGDVAGALAEELARRVAALSPDWTQLEWVTRDVAFSLIRTRDGTCLVLITDLLVGRWAVVRFRGQVGRIASLV
ncbi:MAG: response regulator [Polyangiaceae bacterium]